MSDTGKQKTGFPPPKKAFPPALPPSIEAVVSSSKTEEPNPVEPQKKDEAEASDADYPIRCGMT